MSDQTQWQRFNTNGQSAPGQGVFGADLPSVAGAMIGITHRFHRVSGALAMTTIALPYAGFEGEVVFIPTGAFTGATGGAAGTAIGLAFTAVVGRPIVMTYVPSQGLWYPSYV